MTSASTTGVLVALFVVAVLPHRAIARPSRPTPAVSSNESGAPCDDADRRRGRRRAGTLTVMVAGLAMGGPFIAALALVVVWAAPSARRSTAVRSRRRAVERELPDTVDLFVVAVHSGLTPRQAIIELTALAPVGVRPACAAVVAAMDRGDPLADAIEAMTIELGTAAMPLVDAIRSTERAGLSLVAALESLSVDNRLARRRLDEAAARRLPVTLSFPLVTCTLPSFVLLAVVPLIMATISSLGSQPW